MALEPPLRKVGSQNFDTIHTPNEWLGKVLKFHGASANGFWYRSEKPPGGRFAPPPTSNRVNAKASKGLSNVLNFGAVALLVPELFADLSNNVKKGKI